MTTSSLRESLGFVPIFFILVFSARTPCMADAIPDSPFPQQYHEPYRIDGPREANDVRALAVDHSGDLWAATAAGVYRLPHGATSWKLAAEIGSCFTVAVAPVKSPHAVSAADNSVWVGAWNGVHHGRDKLTRIEGIDAPVSTIAVTGETGLCCGPQGHWWVSEGTARPIEIAATKAVRAALIDGQSRLWLATQMGVYSCEADGRSGSYWNRGLMPSANLRDLAKTPDGRLWVAGLGGVAVFQGDTHQRTFDGDSLSSIDVRCVTPASDGSVWVGTRLGAMRYDGQRWSLRHSRRWLVSDDVRDIVFDGDGTAWIATDQGVSAIKTRKMTLAEKASHYDAICQARHVRAPGLVEKCRLVTPGDVTTWEPSDDDNDGQYTSMYLAMESFRYATTKDLRAKANAKRALEALRFLQTVTDTPGFVARTVIPASWQRMHDPNRELSDEALANQSIDDPRYKYVPVRWHQSTDGKWLWKGDTSSDEITGHYYGYLMYYDLVADEAEKRHVATHVRNVTDYIIDHGFVLKGLDGRRTRWGVWSPDLLNHDPEWEMDRSVNSVEMLSYLKAAYHMTGDAKYQKVYLQLIHEHGYAENARRSKTMGPAWRTHIDDELLALAYPALLLKETDPKLLKIYRESLDRWYAATQEDRGPYFHFTYASLTNQSSGIEESLSFLRDASLDLVRWRIDNSQREDVAVTHYPELERDQTARLLPISEIGFCRWDRNPWDAIQGDGGHTESDGVYWMLPYWMGRYYGYIGEEEK